MWSRFVMEVEQRASQISPSQILAALLKELSAITDHRNLRDSVPRRLAGWLQCQSVLLYQKVGESLQFAAGSCGDAPGWSTALLSVAHINPISLQSSLLEARAWREKAMIAQPSDEPTALYVPLVYRYQPIGVLVLLRMESGKTKSSPWQSHEQEFVQTVAGVVALLLENTRLLERDRERIQELSLLNSISSQMSYSLYEMERMRTIIKQRTREISAADLCELLETDSPCEDGGWITPALRDALFRRFGEQKTPSLLIVERPAGMREEHTREYLTLLPVAIKTFFAFPLFSGYGNQYGNTSIQEPKIQGIVLGAYYRAWKLRREEEVLLQVLANQAGTVLENMHLMEAVLEARNHARKLLRKVLADQRLKKLILESIPSGLVTTDREGQVVLFNRAAEDILGYYPSEVIGQPLQKLLDIRSLDVSELPAAEKSSKRGTVRSNDRQGHELVLDVEVLPLYGDQNDYVGTLATFSDVTTMHRLEEEKRRLDRLASLGEMAANVAHEVRNPLASIKTSMQMLYADLSAKQTSENKESEENDNPCIEESITVVLKEVERLDSIVRDLLLFARPKQMHRMRCNIAELSERVLKLLQTQCQDEKIVVHRLFGRTPALWLDMAQMEQILINLYMNAIQAMPDGGVLTVSCYDIPIPETAETSRKHATRADEQWVELTVSDTGIGIASEMREKIFQPFFTTKAHGIGLGLPITRRLIEDHGGTIHVESHLGYGATMCVRLPVGSSKQIELELEREG